MSTAEVHRVAEPMSQDEQLELIRLVGIVKASLKRIDEHLEAAVAEAAKITRHALLEIKDKGLYRVHGTWQAFAKQIFGMSEVTSFRHLNRARLERLFTLDLTPGEFLEDFSSLSDLVTLSRHQANCLWKYTVEVQLETWRRASAEEENPGPAVLQRHAIEVESDLANARRQDQQSGNGSGEGRRHGENGGSGKAPAQRFAEKLAGLQKIAARIEDDKFRAWFEHWVKKLLARMEEMMEPV